MASSGTPRHSKRNRPGVTIDMAPAETAASADEGAVRDVEAQDTTIDSAHHASAPEEERRQAEAPEPAPVGTDPEKEKEDVFQTSLPPPVQPAAPRGMSGFASGLAGGALALLAGAGLQWAGLLPSFGGSAEIAALRQQVAALAEKSGAPAVDSGAIESLKSAQTALTQNIESLRADILAAGDAQKSISDDVAALKLSGRAGGDPAAIAAMTDKITALQAQIDAAKGSGASAKISEMQAQIAALKQSAGDASGASNVAQAIAAAGLKAAIDRGGSFANELETFATVAPASVELEQLKNLAASGVPSKAELSAEFGKAADAMLAAAQPVDPNAGLIARLTASAKSLVRSRPVGAVEGDAPEALVARMEVAVNKGDLDAALAEAGKLPDAPRAAGIEYIGRLTARRDTDALVTKALTSALSAAGAAK
jgi:hypothetical protein